jgi:hypothetical protein
VSLFAKPASDWSDVEIAAGLAQIGQRLEELHALAVTLADERDRRIVLARQVDDAMNPFRVVP